MAEEETFKENLKKAYLYLSIEIPIVPRVYIKKYRLILDEFIVVVQLTNPIARIVRYLDKLKAEKGKILTSTKFSL